MKMLTLFILLLSANIFAQDTKQAIKEAEKNFVLYILPVEWKAESKAIYSVSYAREVQIGGEVSAKYRSEYVMEVKVDFVEDTLMTMTARFYNFRTDISENELVDSIAAMVNDTELKYLIDNTGSFILPYNINELMVDYKGKLNKLKDHFMGDHDDEHGENGYQDSFDKVQKTIENPHSLAGLFYRPVMMYHAPYGGEYKKSAPIKGATQVPNLTGGEPFPGKISIEVTFVDFESGISRLTMINQVDKKAGKEKIAEFLQKNTGVKPDPEKLNFNYMEVNEIDYDMKDGFLHNAVMKTESSWPGYARFDNYNFTRIDK